MKRIGALWLCLMSLSALGAQDFDEFRDLFEEFGQQVAPSLPMVSAVGSTWSDAYIGQLFPSLPPHFGLGLSAGAALIPSASLEPLFSAFGQDIPEVISQYGLPIPALVADARVGGLILPFDVGVKLGFLPQDTASLGLPNGMSLDYLMFGADVRYALIQENVLLPDVIVGAGYTYLKGSVLQNFGTEITIENVPHTTNQTDGVIKISDPELGLQWEASVIDVKAQVSKSFLIFTPYGGLSASLSVATAGGGLYNTITLYQADGTTEIATGKAAVNNVKNAAENMGGTAPDLSADGVSALAGVNGWSFRAYGGVSLDLLGLRLDTQIQYDLLSQAYGGQLGLRFQL